MPLETATLSANCQFEFTKPVSGWADITQGANQVTFGGAIDPEVWDQVYAAVLRLDPSGTSFVTLDLTNLTNLVGESVAFTAVLGIVITNTPEDPEALLIDCAISPGASNGLEFFTPAMDSVPLTPGRSLVVMEDPTGAGFTVDSTHKTLTIENVSDDVALVRIVIIGKTT